MHKICLGFEALPLKTQHPGALPPNPRILAFTFITSSVHPTPPTYLSKPQNYMKLELEELVEEKCQIQANGGSFTNSMAKKFLESG